MENFFDNELAQRFEEMVENNTELYFDSEEIVHIIIYYLELGDIGYAEMATNYGLKLHPASTEIKIKQLEVLLEQEDYLKAKALMAELEGASQESTDFLVCCAKYYSNLGNPARAITYCEKALPLGEELNFIHNFMADEYVNLGDPFNALVHYREALQEDPMDEYALENSMACFADLKRPEEALAFINEYLDEYPYSEVAWNELGQFYFNRKNYREAIRAYDYLLAINADAPATYTNKAVCYEYLKQWDKAIEVYEELLELEFTKAYTYFRIGLCYRQLDRPLLALPKLQQSLKEDPQFYMAMMEQSMIYEELGAMPEALHFAREATALNPQNMQYQKRLAYLLVDAGHFEDSLPIFEKMVEAEGSKFHNWYAYVEMLMLLEEYDRALEVLKRALKKHKRAELYYQLSNCYFHLNQDAEAEDALLKALEKDAPMAEEMEKKYPFIKDQLKKEKFRK